jgi:hypothetical protein
MPKKFGFFMAAAVFVLALVLGACFDAGVDGGVGGSSNTGRGGGSNPVDGSGVGGGSSNPDDGEDGDGDEDGAGSDEDGAGSDEGGDGDSVGIREDTLVNDLFLDYLVVAPVKDAAPVTTAIDTDQYTSNIIVWQNVDGSRFTGDRFAVNKVYKAVFTLTAKQGFTFNNLAANSFVHTGAIAVTYTVNSRTVNITFPEAAEVFDNVRATGNYLANANADPIPLLVDIDIATDDWGTLLKTIQSKGKKVALDLSRCKMSGTTFDPGTASGCENLIVSLVLPDAAKSIRAGTEEDLSFEDFTALKSVSGKNVQTVDALAFAGTSLTTVDFPAATDIGAWAFYGCEDLTTVNLPKATDIGKYAFETCYALTTVNLLAATKIGEKAFKDCWSLTTVNLPKATDIGDGAFGMDRSSLTTVNLPVATSIGGGAFAGTSLTTVDFPAAATIGYQAFKG